MTLRHKLLILYLAVAIATLSVAGFWLTRRFQQDHLSELERELVNELALVDFALTSFMEEVENDIAALAITDLVRTEDDASFTSFLDADEATFVYDIGELEQRIIDVLNTYRITHPYVNSVYMGRANGSFVRSHKRARPTEYDPRTRPWYILAEQNPGSVMYTEPYQSVTTSDVNIGVVTALINDNGDVYGVVGADVTLANLADYLSGLNIVHHGEVLISGATGTVLVSDTESRQFEPVTSFLGGSTTAFMNQQQGVLQFDGESGPSYLFFYTSPTLGWKLAIEIPVDELNQSVQDSVFTTLFGLFIALLILSILTFIGLNLGVVGPIRKLNAAAIEISQTGELRNSVRIDSSDEIGNLAASFNQMAENVRESQATLREERDLAEALQDVTAALTSSLDFETVLDRILENVSRIIPNEACNIMLIQDQQIKPVRWRGYDKFGVDFDIPEVAFDLSEDTTFRQMMLSQEPVIIPNVLQASNWQQGHENSWVRSYAAAPIIVRDEIIGFLNVDSSTPDFFNDEQLELLRAFAVRAGIAIENTDLYQQVQEHAKDLERRVAAATEEIRLRADELAVLYDISQELSVALDLDTLLPVVARRVTEVLVADRCAVFLFNEDTTELTVRAAHGYMAERFVEGEYRPCEEVVGQTFASGETRYEPDVEFAPDIPRRDDIHTVLAVPLVSATERPIGVISVVSLRQNAFDKGQRRLLETMASQIAGSVERSILYQRTEWHAVQLMALYEIGKEITATLELDTMLSTIADQAVQLVRADKSLILLINNRTQSLTRVVGHGYMDEQLNANSYEEFMTGIRGWVYQEKVPTLSVDIRVDERNRGRALESARLADDRSAAIAPLIIEDEIIGTLTVINSQQGRIFQQADLNLVSMLAGQAAIAIHNAGLYTAAQDADRLKSAFLASMSHELRTPLNSIIGFTGILLQGMAGPLTSEQHKQLGMVRNSAHHLLALVNDVLDISKIEAGQLELNSERVDIPKAVEKAVQTVQPMAEEKGLTLTSDLDPEIDWLTGDRRRVEQILINLLNNAVKFTDEGQVSIKIDIVPASHELASAQDKPALRFRVIDTGIGIKQEHIVKLFKPFQQVDTGLSRQREGTGLGLSICQRLVDSMGGKIWVESEWGLGSTFTFTLPYRE